MVQICTLPPVNMLQCKEKVNKISRVYFRYIHHLSCILIGQLFTLNLGYVAVVFNPAFILQIPGSSIYITQTELGKATFENVVQTYGTSAM